MRTPEQKLLDKIELYSYFMEISPNSLDAGKLENAKKELVALRKNK